MEKNRLHYPERLTRAGAPFARASCGKVGARGSTSFDGRRYIQTVTGMSGDLLSGLPDAVRRLLGAPSAMEKKPLHAFGPVDLDRSPVELTPTPLLGSACHICPTVWRRSLPAPTRPCTWRSATSTGQRPTSAPLWPWPNKPTISKPETRRSTASGRSPTADPKMSAVGPQASAASRGRSAVGAAATANGSLA